MWGGGRAASLKAGTHRLNRLGFMDTYAGLFDDDLDSVAGKLDQRAEAVGNSLARGQVISFPSAEDGV